MSRAVRFDRYGGPEVLYVADVPDPEPSRGEVVVAVRAAGINPGEAAIRFGSGRFPATFPSGQGSDLAGVVAKVGEDVEDFSPGDEVLGWSWQRSSQAELVAVPADQLISKPPALGWEVAGSLYIVGCTAYAAVRAVGVGPADTVGVSAAAGGVGCVVVQLLGLAGATVLGIASELNHGWLRGKGVVPVSYGEGLEQALRDAGRGGIDAFIDLFGPQYVQLAVALGVAPDRIDTIISFEAAAEVGAKTQGMQSGTSTAVLSELAELAARGRIEIPIAATYPLEDVHSAYQRLEERHTRGKIVLIP
jgi:NADPH:quinone reductase-like Zn-dependent oxidoreductase